MHSSILHFNTSFLPVYFGGGAIALHITGNYFKKETLKAISYRMYLLTCLVTTITCGFGGASIRASEASPEVNAFLLKTHAWTAMTVFLLTVFMAYYSMKIIRGKGDSIKNGRLLLITALVFLLFFTATTLIAFRIR